MGISLSGGPFTYNRFQVTEGSKPDFLDMDKDGDKKESFKKAVKDKKDCGCKKEEDCDCSDKKKKDVKEGVTITKDQVISHLVENNYVNNKVSAEIMFTHITDEFLEEIESNISEGYKSLPVEKMSRQANKAYGKEQQSVSKGDEAGANKQMQRRIAMQNPSGRKSQLSK